MKCLKCQKTIMKAGFQEPDGSYWLEPGESQKIEGDSSTSFILCPHCGAKNILGILPKTGKGPMKYRLTRYEE
jgi:DNA-directed RNA polymerase subunit RPC12/RpoP